MVFIVFVMWLFAAGVALVITAYWEECFCDFEGDDIRTTVAIIVTCAIAAAIGFAVVNVVARERLRPKYERDLAKGEKDQKFVQEFLVKSVPALADGNPDDIFFEKDKTGMYVRVVLQGKEELVTDNEVVRVVGEYDNTYHDFDYQENVKNDWAGSAMLWGWAGSFLVALIAGILRRITTNMYKLMRGRRRRLLQL